MLDDPAAQDPEVVGGKAATLARLRGASFPVPPGAVLTRAACDRVVVLPPAPADKASEARPVLPADIRLALSALVDELGGAAGPPLAVRSSDIAEDLPEASFAGQYETVLRVRGIAALEDAIRRCLTSAASDRLAAYARRLGARAAMAVLIQEMVQAEAAGVAFTANPVTGDRETIVSAVRGVGDRLVGGEATPDEWVVRDGEVMRLSGSEEAIHGEVARQVADLAARVEAFLGGPQDIEWAVADGQLHLLQARPITSLPRRPEIQPPTDGFWTKDDAHYPMPLTPFGASVLIPALVAGQKASLDEFGLLLDSIDQRSIAGEVYIRPVPWGGGDGQPPWWVLWLAVRLVPAMRRRARIADAATRSRLADRLVERWESEWRGAFRAASRALLARELPAMTDPELLNHLRDGLEHLGRGENLHLRLFAPYILRTYELAAVCSELLAWTPLEAMTLLSGTSRASSAPGRALAELASAIAARPDARGVADADPEDLLSRLRTVSPEIGEAIDAYLEEHGHRTLSYDAGDATLFERPWILANLLRERLAADQSGGAATQDDARASAVRQARATLAGRTQLERDRFEQALAAAERVYPVREDNIIDLDNIPAGILRYAMLECGRRLADRGLISAADDAAFLEVDELRSALQGGLGDARSMVVRRRAERAWVAAHPGPATYGRRPPWPPDLRGLPPALHHVTSSFVWMMETLLPPDVTARREGQIVGLPGSPGSYSGPVRVVHDETEFGRLRRGDVLVCPITTPSWSVLFTQAGAIVTDGGGVLAHAAIIAREYGVPAVLATKDGTRRLRDGQLVTVDGTAGLVSIT
jgi:pyruvate,water dikinase